MIFSARAPLLWKTLRSNSCVSATWNEATAFTPKLGKLLLVVSEGFVLLTSLDLIAVIPISIIVARNNCVAPDFSIGNNEHLINSSNNNNNNNNNNNKNNHNNHNNHNHNHNNHNKNNHNNNNNNNKNNTRLLEQKIEAPSEADEWSRLFTPSDLVPLRNQTAPGPPGQVGISWGPWTADVCENGGGWQIMYSKLIIRFFDTMNSIDHEKSGVGMACVYDIQR